MIHQYGLDQASIWKALVEGFSAYDVYYLPGYVHGFQLHGDGEPYLLYYEEDGMRAINVVMLRDVSEARLLSGKVSPGEFFDLSTPYGYGGWLIEGSGQIDRLFYDYDAFCHENNIVSEFVRFHPVLGNASLVKGHYDISVLGPTIALTLESADQVWSNMTSKNRNMVRKARKNGLQIGHGSSPELYREFKQLYDETMLRDKAADYYYFDESMYESLMNDLPDNSKVFYVTFDDDIVAASIIIYADGHLNYHLSGSKAEYRSFAPSNLLLYEAARWGTEQGMKSFHLGGGVGAKEDNLYRFKRSFFRGEPLVYAVGKKIFDSKTYDLLIEQAGAYNKPFFPGYRS